MKFQTSFPPKPSHTNHSKYLNCLSWKYRIASHHTQLILEYTADPGSQPCKGLPAPPKPCHITSLPCCGLSGRAPLFFFHHFWGQILHSTAVFVYRTRNERRIHTLDPAEFFFWHPLLQTTQYIQPCRPITICHRGEPKGWVERQSPSTGTLYYRLHIL